MSSVPEQLVGGTGGVFTRADAISLGYHDDDLAAWVRSGSARRLRRGIFAGGPTPEYADARLVERAQGLSRRHSGRLAISHHAALLVHGVAVYGVPLGTLHAARLSGNARSASSLLIARPRGRPPTVSVADVVTVRPEVAVVQVACTYGFVAGLVAADSALHTGAMDRTALEGEIERVGGLPGVQRARTVAARCREGAESPGETLLRVAVEDLGLKVETQFPISEGDRPPFAYADLRIVGTRVLLEFDGAVKYAGAQGREALVKEKSREDRIRRWGWLMERVVWRDFDHPSALRERLKDVVQRSGVDSRVSNDPNSARSRSAS
ncbi:MAG: type IV toxin-antitoxin system AbiEi family antitoxin domain-containing protein [Ornithinimicrobium sp.]